MSVATAPIPTDRATFVERFGSVIEHSPWAAERAFDAGPFTDGEAVHAAFEQILLGAPREHQLEVLCAHPELAAERAIPRESLTPESRSEQAGAGLDTMADERRTALAQQLAAYRARFGFPFIACVRDHGGHALEALVRERFARAPEAELRTALAEVCAIARYRILDLVEGGA